MQAPLKLQSLFSFSLSFSLIPEVSPSWLWGARAVTFAFLLSLSVYHNPSCSVKMSGCCPLWLKKERHPWANPSMFAVLWASLTLCVFVRACILCLCLPVYAQQNAIKMLCNRSSIMGLFLSSQQPSPVHKQGNTVVEGRCSRTLLFLWLPSLFPHSSSSQLCRRVLQQVAVFSQLLHS